MKQIVTTKIVKLLIFYIDKCLLDICQLENAFLNVYCKSNDFSEEMLNLHKGRPINYKCR